MIKILYDSNIRLPLDKVKVLFIKDKQKFSPFFLLTGFLVLISWSFNSFHNNNSNPNILNEEHPKPILSFGETPFTSENLIQDSNFESGFEP